MQTKKQSRSDEKSKTLLNEKLSPLGLSKKFGLGILSPIKTNPRTSTDGYIVEEAVNEV